MITDSTQSYYQYIYDHSEFKEVTLLLQLMKNRVLLVMLVVGLSEKPNSFLPLEHKAGGEDKPVAVRCSLECTVLCPAGDQKDGPNSSANFTRTVESPFVHDNVPNLEDEMCAGLMIKSGRLNERSGDDAED